MPVLRMLALLLAVIVGGGPVATLAQDDATPNAGSDDPSVGTAVPFLDESGDEIGVVSVVEVTDPWEDFSEFFDVDDGSRYVAVEVSVEATSDQIEADPFDFGLQTADGFFYSRAFVSRDVTSGDVRDLDSITVDVDDVVSGLLFFQVPEEAELARLLWQPESGRLILLADLRA